MTTDKFDNILLPAVLAVGLEYWGYEFIPAHKNSVLRVYVDKEGGATIDDCQLASQQISVVLDVEDFIKNRYRLEVSTPGLDRLLFSKEQYDQFIGQEIKIELYAALDNQRKFKGVLESVASSGDITLKIEGKSQNFILADIKKARLVAKI